MSLFAEETKVSLDRSLSLPKEFSLEVNCKMAVSAPALNVSAILSRVTGELERFNGIISKDSSLLNEDKLASHVNGFVNAAQKIYTKLEQCHQAYVKTKDPKFLEMQNTVLFRDKDRNFEGAESKGLIDFLRAGMDLEHSCVNLAKAAKNEVELLDAYDLFAATRKALNYFCERDPNGDFIRDAIEPIASKAIGSDFHSTFFGEWDLKDMAAMLRKIGKTPRAFDQFDPNRDPAHVLGQNISYAANSVLGKMNAYAKDALDPEQMLNAKSDWDEQ